MFKFIPLIVLITPVNGPTMAFYKALRYENKWMKYQLNLFLRTGDNYTYLWIMIMVILMIYVILIAVFDRIILNKEQKFLNFSCRKEEDPMA
jgi:hypothetical protein